jgi:FSR family fosmidomycin resistance protein-like MFS transporter
MKNLDLVFKNLNFICFLTAVAAGTLIGGPLGDRFEGNTSFGFQFWEPFTLLLPYANLF